MREFVGHARGQMRISPEQSEEQQEQARQELWRHRFGEAAEGRPYRGELISFKVVFL